MLTFDNIAMKDVEQGLKDQSTIELRYTISGLI